MDYLKDIWNKILNKIKKMGVKRCLLISICMVLLIIIILVIGSYVQDKVFENKVKNKNYTSMKDFESVKEVVIYMGCNYIKEDKDKGYVYLEFNKDLYENNRSNRKFFENLSAYIANVLNYSDYTMIDNSKNIIIEIKCDKENKTVTDMIINGNTNYFADEDSKKQISNYVDIKNTELTVNSNVLNKLINEDWVESRVKFGTKDSSFEKYDIYFDEGIEVRKIGSRVFNIIFTNKYSENVVNNIKVGESFENIEKILGKPTFEQENIVGYKSDKIYVFFEKDEISVYRVEEGNNEDFVNLINNLENENDIKKIASTLTDIFPDYDEYEIQGESIRIIYSSKGIELKYNITNQQGFTLYNNYTGNIKEDKTIKNIDGKDIPKYVYIDSENNLVFLTEQKRRAQIEERSYYYSLQLNEDETNKLNVLSSEFDYYIKYEQNNKIIKFFSKDNKYPKIELEVNFNSYMWIDDYRFMYSIKNKGIYALDLRNQKTTTIIEGNEEFNFKSYNNNILKYDEKMITIK